MNNTEKNNKIKNVWHAVVGMYRTAVQPPRDPRPILVNLNAYYIILIYFDRPRTFDRPPRSVSLHQRPTLQIQCITRIHREERHPKEGEYI